MKANLFRVLALAAVAGAASASSAAVGDLWAVSGSGSSPSNLYRVDKSTGAATLVGSTGLSHITGLAFDPTSGILYGHENGVFGGSGTSYVLQFDTSTGAATRIAATTIQSPDMDFDSSGQLWAWAEYNTASGRSDLVTKVDKSTGAVSELTSAFWGTYQTGLGFDTGGTLWVKNGGQIGTVNTSSGDVTYLYSLSGTAQNALDFDPTSGRAYSINRSGSATDLVTIDTGSGAVSTIGPMGVGQISALAFEIPAPGSLALLGLGGLAAARRRRA